MIGIAISWWGAVLGLVLAIVLILKKVNAVYALFAGSLIGGVVGGASLNQTVTVIINGTNSVMPAVVRVLTAGILAGVLIESGAAEKIAETIVEKLGEKKALLAIALATLIITAVGVFVTVAIIIVAPIALSVAKRVGISKTAVLLTMVGGGKAGNVMSPNPNTIAVAKGFNLELTQVMIAGFIPALVGLIVTCIVGKLLSEKGTQIKDSDLVVKKTSDNDNEEKPSFLKAMVAPIVAIVLLGINPIGSILNIEFLKKISIDSMIILPVAGLVGLVAMGKAKNILKYTASGLNMMSSTAILLIGAGSIAGIISNSNLSSIVVNIIKTSGISGTLLAPISGILMAAATGSTSTGAILATGSFEKAILAMGVAPISAAVMVHTGAVVIDHLPHGNFFLVSAQSVKMDISDRMKLIPYESIVGGSICLTATVIYGFLM
ncbi:MAG: TRAP transporter large permease subunit [Clostridium sp.]|jgi:GntP family gluconate:H+ symporter|uniref:GntP family permease n=1 Tax=Clostridium sp. TaxID=1506 RepID=UPI0025BD5161|nr:SLC13 family permease [Clostridium sp.]MCH3965804.1 TRAP transporter large permease subunit [Clostridium sp.]MCI1717304.1 TRAP transporter large permease subunit [Clostridium sp.]MCI1801644.1 TRAP transporter large permease subunit [Clostridium sp.]MCI1815490.1 TRAP transporter large permease subunit [Clostridium sp.]MCI1872411.1 TRAP transporter large permease subunit [Clostridium sp.]